VAQGNAPQSPRANQALQSVNGPRSVDEELYLTKNWNSPRKQWKQIRSLLVEHNNRIQALLDKSDALTGSSPTTNPRDREETHHEIEAPLTDRQK
jgi:hypothetical protein